MIEFLYFNRYKNLHELVDQVFPPMDSFSASESYSSFTFWREPVKNDAFQDEMLAALEEINARQKLKGKGSSAQLASTSPKVTTVAKVADKSLTIAQANEHTVKKP